VRGVSLGLQWTTHLDGLGLLAHRLDVDGVVAGLEPFPKPDVSAMVDRGEAEQDGAVGGGLAFHLLKLLLCAGEADLQSFDLAEPVVLLGFGDTGVKVGDDLAKPVGLGGVESEQRAAEAGFTELVNGAARFSALLKRARRVSADAGVEFNGVDLAP
jgi:hypothetical protein